MDTNDKHPRGYSQDVLQHLRKQAIRLRKSGKRYKEISEAIGIHHTTICTWCNNYEREGKAALKFKGRRGRRPGTCRTLSKPQEKEVQKAIRDRCPNQLKMPFALWDRRAVQQIIKLLHGIDMPIRTVGEYLKRWGFTPQRPLKKAYRQNPKAVKKWLEEEYPAIKKRAKNESAEIHWGDETGLCNTSYHGRSYAPKGNTPAITVHPRCERVNLRRATPATQ